MGLEPRCSKVPEEGLDWETEDGSPPQEAQGVMVFNNMVKAWLPRQAKICSGTKSRGIMASPGGRVGEHKLDSQKIWVKFPSSNILFTE